MKDETRERLLCSEEFRSWSLEPAPEPKPATIGRGQTDKFVGKKYTNLIVDENTTRSPKSQNCGTCPWILYGTPLPMKKAYSNGIGRPQEQREPTPFSAFPNLFLFACIGL